MSLLEQMREDWNRRAREDANFYVAFARRRQDDRDFLASAAEVVGILEQEFVRLPPAPAAGRRALEIGCGPGRLMLPMSRHFGEIHGIDISGEMIAMARERLRDVTQARLHLTGGADLAMLAADYFDFAYSYTVFQHIPDPEIVWNYLREARRVLRPGGVLCCQLRGAPPLRSETEREASTWTGCYFSGEQMATFARDNELHLVSLTGLDTQYMWTTWLKPANHRPPRPAMALKAVTAANSGETRVPARGRDAVVALWIDGLPAGAHLGNLEVSFGGARTRGCYLSPVSVTGACQMNVRLPGNTPPGAVAVQLCDEGIAAVPAPCSIEVLPPPPRDPKVLSVSDGVNIASCFRIEMGGAKVTIEDVERPEEVSFTVAGRPAEFLQFERKDPVASIYEFAFHLSHKTRLGIQPLVVEVSGRRLPPLQVEIAGVTEHRQAGQEQHDTEAGGAGGAPLGPAVVGKRNLARALARWFHRQKS
ncbi:MAG: class I SAM-dependent methyltransferase [Acidobacteriia bacterium]|nr:class I SAM-dependent methyltransferase [Terriglobia bacterium]